MATRALTLDDVNLLDHDLFAEREPWDVFELLQREAPVFRHPEPDGDGFWCVTRYDDVVAGAQGHRHVTPRRAAAPR